MVYPFGWWFSPTVIDKSLANRTYNQVKMPNHRCACARSTSRRTSSAEGIMCCSAGFILNTDTPTKLLSQWCNLQLLPSFLPCSSQLFARSHFLSVKQWTLVWRHKYVPKVCLIEGNSFSYIPFWCSFKTYYVTDRNGSDSDTILLQSARISDPSSIPL